jgi:hypothetical protein
VEEAAANPPVRERERERERGGERERGIGLGTGRRRIGWTGGDGVVKRIGPADMWVHV